MLNRVCFDSIPKFGDKTKIQVYLENTIFWAFDSLDCFLSTTTTPMPPHEISPVLCSMNFADNFWVCTCNIPSRKLATLTHTVLLNRDTNKKA